MSSAYPIILVKRKIYALCLIAMVYKKILELIGSENCFEKHNNIIFFSMALFSNIMRQKLKLPV